MSTRKLTLARKNFSFSAMPEEIRRLLAEINTLKARLDKLRVRLRQARGREIKRRNEKGETIDQIARDMGISRQYAHKLIREAEDS